MHVTKMKDEKDLKGPGCFCEGSFEETTNVDVTAALGSMFFTVIVTAEITESLKIRVTLCRERVEFKTCAGSKIHLKDNFSLQVMSFPCP